MSCRYVMERLDEICKKQNLAMSDMLNSWFGLFIGDIQF